MTRDDIIKELIDKEFIEKLCTTFSSMLGENKDDFYGELWLIILEIPEEKLIKLYEEKSLYFYLLSVARNQVVNDRSTFNRMYNKKITTISIDDYLIDIENENNSEEY